MKKQKLLVISLDALSTSDIEILRKNKEVDKIFKQGSLVKDVHSPFITNTYPIHTSVITGRYPCDHGIIDNTYLEFNNPNPQWRWYYNLIKTESIVSLSKKAGYKVGTIFWPVMASAPVDYNIPEVLAGDHENQLVVVLKNSTKLFALTQFLKSGLDVKGSKQPNLDNFSIKPAMTLIKKKVDLVLVHFTDTDTQKHIYGINSEETLKSLDRMSQRIIDLFNLAKDDYQIIIMSDHSQLDIQEVIDLNKLDLHPNIWWHQCAGSAFLTSNQKLTVEEIKNIEKQLKAKSYFERTLTEEEMTTSGFSSHSDLGVTPKIGYAFYKEEYGHIGNHGYPTDLPNYQPFYYVYGDTIKENQQLSGGTLLDIFPLMTKLLNLEEVESQGNLKTELFK